MKAGCPLRCGSRKESKLQDFESQYLTRAEFFAFCSFKYEDEAGWMLVRGYISHCDGVGVGGKISDGKTLLYMMNLVSCTGI